MELTDEVYNSINNYFSVLTHLGYKQDSEVNKLIIFTFLEELLYGPLSEFITEEDYKLISRSLHCLYGSCMIPYPDYKKSYSPIIHKMYEKYRITETNEFRGSENYELRVKS